MIVALLTDFGTRDHYVGVMKGVVLGVCPKATLVDITHEIAPQDIVSGAVELAAAYPYFPPGTVFLVVVDPGVGSTRRGMAAECGGYRFVGPDNGVMSGAFSTGGDLRCVELRDTQYALPTMSRTFEGRDRFAPAAGWLARGTDLEAFGPRILDPVVLELPRPALVASGIEGEVVRVDRFGNLITNIDRETLEALPSRDVEVHIGGRRITCLVATYADAIPGEVCALFSSSGYIEIALNGGSAAAMLGVSKAARVRVAAKASR